MERQLKVLILEDSKTDAEISQRFLLKHEMHCEFKLAMNRESFIKSLEEFSPDVILSDNSLPGFTGSDALKIARQWHLHVPFILVTGTVSEEYAANIIKEGADDYILKDRMARLPAAIEAALQQRKAMKELTDYKYAMDESAIIAITDQEGIILYANENFCRISKFTSAELVGQDHRIINSGYHTKSFIKNLWTTIENGQIWRNEIRNRAKDGSFYWVDCTIVPFLNKEGKPYQYLSIRKDITEQKKAEDERLRLSVIIESTPDFVAIADLDQQVLFLNKGAREMADYGESEDVTGNLISDFMPAGAYKILREAGIPEAMKEGKWSGEISILNKNGSEIPVSVVVIVHKTANGIPRYISIIARDITERIKTEKELKHSEMMLNEAQEISQIGNFEIDLINSHHTWSDEYYRIFGIDKTITGASLELFLSFIHPEDIKATRKKIERIFRDHKNASVNFRFIRTDGKLRYGFSKWKFEFNEEGIVIRLFGILQDITERTEAEEKLKSLENRILNQKIQEQKKIARAIMQGQEKEKNHIARELHDNINQILAGTRLYLGVEGKKNELVKEAVQYPIELLDSSIQEIRLLCSTMVAPAKNVDLDEMIRDLLIKLDQAGGIKTSLTFTVTGKVMTDELKLNIYRILQEHVNNILKYAEAKNVSVSITEQEDIISIIISDDGIGFDVKKKRNGIGISNIMNRVATFNGEIEIKSSPGNGCTTMIKIPCQESTDC